jgi:hypothetical protein
MKKIINASFLAAFALTMLLPVARGVNAMSVNQPDLRQAGNPLPGGSGGGHFNARQAGNPLPGGSGGGHFTLRQAGNPLPGGSGGGHFTLRQAGNPLPGGSGGGH